MTFLVIRKVQGKGQTPPTLSLVSGLPLPHPTVTLGSRAGPTGFLHP